MSEIRPNRAKRKLAEGLPVIAVAGLADGDAIDLMGAAGIDAVWIEAEHGPFDHHSIPDLTRACDLWGMTSIVRVNESGYGPIYRMLDLGAQGIAVPHIDTAEQARDMVSAGKFSPIGRRGVGPGRQSFGVANYLARANDETLLIAFVEDIKAVENLDEILEVDHIDVFFVAPSDLAASMGHLGNADHPEVVRQRDIALGKIMARGRNAGTLANSYEDIAFYLPRGVNFMMTNAQIWLKAAARDLLAQVDAAVDKRRR